MSRTSVSLFARVLVVSVAATLCGCAWQPTVTLDNATPRHLRGYVQIPSIAAVGYPPPSSRQGVKLGHGEIRTYTYRSDGARTVQNYGSHIHVAIARRDGDWYLAKIDAGEAPTIRLRIMPDAEGNARVEGASRSVDERIVTEEKLFEAFGEERP